MNNVYAPQALIALAVEEGAAEGMEAETSDREALWSHAVDNARAAYTRRFPDLSENQIGELALCYANALINAMPDENT